LMKKRGLSFGGAIEIMGYAFMITFAITLISMFEVKKTFHVTEEVWKDPSLPYLQAISYKTIPACGRNVKMYEALAIASLSQDKTVDLCGEMIDLEDEIRSIMSSGGGEFSGYIFRYDLRDQEGSIISAGKSTAELRDEGKVIKKVNTASYLVPLPLEDVTKPPERLLYSRQIISKIEVGN
jgi:hypothetical protein